ncbi:Methyltransferase domain-containing protein [Halolactibacillus halophilus]|uniref:Methyltransferase domain-containing protein n=2 Tax=Halolactibacillus halophilus TaxID=306540 RepID=A0A1I5LEU7_9BACI|nr:class I SAM-dependent methyltransferase [Halolactibacillus halophilus]GEM00851.1 hypothetical protein HHA03_03830 [Halolactibacillus halophilus]SFO95889.1 Methyltransferase domain-containing protein [Halolactibacillus halophilus]
MGKIMASVYDIVMYPFEKLFLTQKRRLLLKQASGHVLDIGSGTGVNFPFFNPETTTVYAIEPDQAMREKANQKSVPDYIHIEATGAEAIPVPDDTFDTVVSTLVFCSIDKPEQVFNEIKRVLKPGGQLYFIEHIRATSPSIQSIQDTLTPMWKQVADGCHLNRPTDQLIEQHFTIIKKAYYFKKIVTVIIAENTEIDT